MIVEKPTRTIQCYYPVEVVFPGARSNLETLQALLCDKPLTETLIMIGRINLILCNQDLDHRDKMSPLLPEPLSKEVFGSMGMFAKSHGGKENVHLATRAHMLELIQWACLYCKDVEDTEFVLRSSEVRNDLKKAVMIAGDLYFQRIKMSRIAEPQKDDAKLETALGPFRRSQEGMMANQNIMHTLGRGWLFFNEYFPEHYPNFHTYFQQTTGLSLEEYYLCMAYPLIEFSKTTLSSVYPNIKAYFKHPRMAEIYKKYFEYESIDPQTLRDALSQDISIMSKSEEKITFFNLYPIRDKPLLRSRDGRLIALDAIFYGEKASIGPFFHVRKGRSPSEIQHLHSAFGKAFERYACTILENMFPDTKDQHLECDHIITVKKGTQYQVDALLKQQQTLYVFEMKTSWLPEGKILTDNYFELANLLRERYGVSKQEDGQKKVKGVGQLARIIEVICTEHFREIYPEYRDINIIYPILVTYDSLLSGPLVGTFFNSEFKKFLSYEKEIHTSNGYLLIHDVLIAPHVIMTLQDLENLEYSQEEFRFHELLNEYTSSELYGTESLHNFIAYSDNYKIIGNKRLTGITGDFLDQARKILFPKT